jgi:hypothetical protein
MSLGMHQRTCLVCARQQCEEIEAAFIGWNSPEAIAEEYELAGRASAYRHARNDERLATILSASLFLAFAYLMIANLFRLLA